MFVCPIFIKALRKKNWQKHFAIRQTDFQFGLPDCRQDVHVLPKSGLTWQGGHELTVVVGGLYKAWRGRTDHYQVCSICCGPPNVWHLYIQQYHTDMFVGTLGSTPLGKLLTYSKSVRLYFWMWQFDNLNYSWTRHFCVNTVNVSLKIKEVNQMVFITSDSNISSLVIIWPWGVSWSLVSSPDWEISISGIWSVWLIRGCRSEKE